jgi:hypothetical protein
LLPASPLPATQLLYNAGLIGVPLLGAFAAA